jgi:3-oxoadipate CoA-transferase beta subunit
MTIKPLTRNQMAWRAAQDIQDGTVVNLGIGMPVLVADYLPEGRDVFFQSENGVIGVGPAAAPNAEDSDLVDAGSRKITLRPGATIVDSAGSFAMIRGGHIDVTILGAFEVATNGDLANWDMRVPNKGPLVGGAMDLAVGAKACWTIMEHNTRKGGPRLLDSCTLPLTAVRCVKRIFTDIAVVDVTPEGFLVREILAGMTAEEVQARTGARFTLASDCKPLVAPPEIAEKDAVPA